ncbi:hypothetical protein [Promineifilum sp.]|uniref:hypothetical protein n=1 Tax=Promineifilum sp. TaxID=2664178 RepID=UPI0035B245F3
MFPRAFVKPVLILALFAVMLGSSYPVASSPQESHFSYLPISLKPACFSYAASTILLPSKTTVPAGETFTVEVNLENTGCVALGRPIYEINMRSEQQPTPVTIVMEVHHFSVPPRGLDSIDLPISLSDASDVTLTAVVTFEVHYDSGPPVWGRSESQPVSITVTP